MTLLAEKQRAYTQEPILPRQKRRFLGGYMMVLQVTSMPHHMTTISSSNKGSSGPDSDSP